MRSRSFSQCRQAITNKPPSRHDCNTARLQHGTTATIDTFKRIKLSYIVMAKVLLILSFIASVGVNSLAGVNPHLDGDGGCAASCCRAAHKEGRESVVSRFCCLFDCKQSGESQSSSTIQIAAAQKKDSFAAYVVFNLEAVLSTAHSTFPNSPTRKIAGSSDRYLETGALLI